MLMRLGRSRHLRKLERLSVMVPPSLHEVIHGLPHSVQICKAVIFNDPF